MTGSVADAFGRGRFAAACLALLVVVALVAPAAGVANDGQRRAGCGVAAQGAACQPKDQVKDKAKDKAKPRPENAPADAPRALVKSAIRRLAPHRKGVTDRS